MPADLITLAHFAMSSAIILPNSAGVIGGSGVAPRSTSRFLIVASETAALICLLSVAMISAGVPFGAPMPIQALAS